MDRVDLGLRMQSWHSSMGDPIYAVGSYYFAGHIHPEKETVEAAIDNLNAILSRSQRMLKGEKVTAPTMMGHTDDLRKFAGYTDKDLKDNIKDLEEIVAELTLYLKKDYENVRDQGRSASSRG